MNWIDRLSELLKQKKEYSRFIASGHCQDTMKLIDEIGDLSVEIHKIRNMSVEESENKIKFKTIKIESK